MDTITVILPEAIVEYIISFLCDRRGYNMINYKQRKKDNSSRMRRLLLEIKYFGKTGYTVPWLKPIKCQRIKTCGFKKSLKDGKPAVVYHTGCYINYSMEIGVFPHLRLHYQGLEKI